MISLAHELFMSEHYPVTLSKQLKVIFGGVKDLMNHPFGTMHLKKYSITYRLSY